MSTSTWDVGWSSAWKASAWGRQTKRQALLRGRSVPMPDVSRLMRTPEARGAISALETSLGSAFKGVGYSDEGVTILVSANVPSWARKGALANALEAWRGRTAGSEVAQLPVFVEWRRR